MPRTLTTHLLASAALLGLATAAQPVLADTLTQSTLVVDVDPPNTEADYCGTNATCLKDGWTGGDFNVLPANDGKSKGFENLDNSNASTEEHWLEALLGKTYDDPGINYINRITAPQGSGNKTLAGYDPGFAWKYAVIKPDNYWIAVVNDGSNKISGTFNYGISHVTFFTPLPAAGLLFGSALLGMWGLRRWRERGDGAPAAA